MERFVAAAIQMTSTEDREQNLAQAIGLIDEAVARGAQFVALPENVDLIARPDMMVEAAEPLDGPTLRIFSEAARQRGIWLLAGTVNETSPVEGKARNTSVLFDSKGERVAAYRKIHLFDVDLDGGASFRESESIEGGTETIVADTSLARFGLSVCYDLRFPELYRELSASGAEVLLIPSAFTLQTGKDHWEVLLRARAIENSCWVIAPAQTGRHLRGRVSYGHSMIIDPWGIVVARCSDGPGVCIAVIEPEVTERTRRSVPSLQHRRVHSS
jgi:deaminated glutathione amidase